MSIDLIWAFASFIITLLVFSYIFGDNPLFRIATYLFVGVSAAYVTLLVAEQVIWPRLLQPVIGGSLLEVVPLLLGIMLLTKLVPRYARYGSLPMAYLVGTAAAVAIGGAVFGTLIGQAQGTINEFDLAGAAGRGISPAVQGAEAGLMLLGVVTTLAYFHFSARPVQGQPPVRLGVIQTLGQVGQFFIAITLGALFAGVFSSALMALIDRLDYLLKFIFTYLIK